MTTITQEFWRAVARFAGPGGPGEPTGYFKDAQGHVHPLMAPAGSPARHVPRYSTKGPGAEPSGDLYGVAKAAKSDLNELLGAMATGWVPIYQGGGAGHDEIEAGGLASRLQNYRAVTKDYLPKSSKLEGGGEHRIPIKSPSGHVPASQKQALRRYQSPDPDDDDNYSVTNAALRYGGDSLSPKAAKDVKALDAYVGGGTFTQDTTLHRGMPLALAPKELRGEASEMVGETFTDKAYVSTTTDPSIAKQYFDRGMGEAGEADPEDREAGVHLIIRAPAGAHGRAPAQDGIDTGGEGEVLLPRNSRFRVTKVHDVDEDGLRHRHISVDLEPA